MKAKLQELEMERSKITDIHQKSSSETTQKIQDFENEIAELKQENKTLMDQFQDVESTKSAQIAELQIKIKELQDKFESSTLNVAKLEDEKRVIEESYKQNSKQSEENFKEIQEALVNEKAELEIKFKEKEQELLVIFFFSKTCDESFS